MPTNDSFEFELQVLFCFEVHNLRFTKWKGALFANYAESVNESPLEWRMISGWCCI